MSDRFTAINSKPVDNSSCDKVLYPSEYHPTHLQLDIKFTQMIGQDYVFLCSERPLLSHKACQQQTFELREQLELDRSRTEFVLVSQTNTQYPRYQRCAIHWIDNYPASIEYQPLKTESQQDYYQTLFDHSEALSTKLL